MTQFIGNKIQKTTDDYSHISLYNERFERIEEYSKKTEDTLAVCKKVERIDSNDTNNAIKRYKYYVKYNRRDGLIFNPHTDSLMSIDKRKGSNDSYLYTFKEVPKAIFDKYIEFLQKPTTYMFKQVNTECKRC